MINMYSLSADEHSTLVRISFYVILGRRGCHFLFYASFPHQKKKKKNHNIYAWKKTCEERNRNILCLSQLQSRNCGRRRNFRSQILKCKRRKRKDTSIWLLVHNCILWCVIKHKMTRAMKAIPRTGPASFVRVPNIAFELLKFFSSLK